MFISIRTLQGEETRIQCEPHDSVLSVKEKLRKARRILIELQRLLFRNVTLVDRKTLSSYNIRDGDSVQLVLRNAENIDTIIGGYGLGHGHDDLCYPYGVVACGDQSLLITDWGNHRVLRWELNERQIRSVAGNREQGAESNQLNHPTDLVFDKRTNSIIISDRGNRRVVRWSLGDDAHQGEILIENIMCWGLATQDGRHLYVSETDNHEVRLYVIGEQGYKVVAGGHGKGVGLNQLNFPSYLCVDEKSNLYVSDTFNHRVMKWPENAEKGDICAKGNPRGLFVDPAGTLYIANYGSSQLQRCLPTATDSETLFPNDKHQEEEGVQPYFPWNVTMDPHGHLYVADHQSHRIQRLPLAAQ